MSRFNEVVCGEPSELAKFNEWLSGLDNRPNQKGFGSTTDVCRYYSDDRSVSAGNLLPYYLAQNDGSFAISMDSSEHDNVYFTRLQSRDGFVSAARLAMNWRDEDIVQHSVSDAEMVDVLHHVSEMSVADVDQLYGDLYPLLSEYVTPVRECVAVGDVDFDMSSDVSAEYSA